MFVHVFKMKEIGLQNIAQFGAQSIGRFENIKTRPSLHFGAQLAIYRPIWSHWLSFPTLFPFPNNATSHLFVNIMFSYKYVY